VLRKTLLAWPMVYALALASCAGTPEMPTSPSAAPPVDVFAYADGSTAKVSAPTGLRPHGVTLSTHAYSGELLPAAASTRLRLTSSTRRTCGGALARDSRVTRARCQNGQRYALRIVRRPHHRQL
jgi:hypothetical protein